MTLSPILLDHFKRPRRTGRLEAPTARGTADNPGCGDLVEVEVRVVADVLEAARFLARGCSATIAGASFVLERAESLGVDAILALDADALWAEAGERSEARRHGVVLALDALKRALRGSP
ncbi:MAG: iron-sulfur cluster assembly scaffold protein [Planctomycetes bacterium]|nr:iron-sulfur cluster assembly scaffold protein [Planctomycetota bacterium]MCC7170328.1 iron-sulfur cluster assembly scaffold protein [Planctomycetota bacterium]